MIHFLSISFGQTDATEPGRHLVPPLVFGLYRYWLAVLTLPQSPFFSYFPFITNPRNTCVFIFQLTTWARTLLLHFKQRTFPAYILPVLCRDFGSSLPAAMFWFGLRVESSIFWSVSVLPPCLIYFVPCTPWVFVYCSVLAVMFSILWRTSWGGSQMRQ